LGQRNGASPNNPTINHGASGSTQEGTAGERLEKSASPITSTHRGANRDQQKQGLADFFDPNATPHFSSHSPGEQTVIEQIATSNNAVLDWLRIKNT
jgi:hypothetical protein